MNDYFKKCQIYVTLPSVDNCILPCIEEKTDSKCILTDFAILLGADVSDSKYLNNDNSLKNRTGDYFSNSSNKNGFVKFLNKSGRCSITKSDNKKIAIRPILKFSNYTLIDNFLTKKNNDIYEIEFGEYPSYAVSKEKNYLLNELYNLKKIKETGKTYTIDSNRNLYKEYEYNEKKYIKVKNQNNNTCIMSNGLSIDSGIEIWIEVSTIEWLFYKQYGEAISKKLLFSGILFDDKKFYNFGYNNSNFCNFEFNKTKMFKFLNSCFITDIIPSIIEKKKLENEKQKILKIK